jgi:hypothetical protein
MSSPKAATPKPPRRSSAKTLATAKAAAKRAPAASPAARAAGLAADIERALAEGRIDVLPPEAVQALMSAACRTYAAQIESGVKYPPLAPSGAVTATDVMVTASGLLRAADLQVFELGMWVSYTGR